MTSLQHCSNQQGQPKQALNFLTAVFNRSPSCGPAVRSRMDVLSPRGQKCACNQSLGRSTVLGVRYYKENATGDGDFRERVVVAGTLDNSDLNGQLPCRVHPWPCPLLGQQTH